MERQILFIPGTKTEADYLTPFGKIDFEVETESYRLDVSESNLKVQLKYRLYTGNQIACAIGVAKPVSVSVNTFGTGAISDEKILKLIDEHFDLRPSSIIKGLGLRKPIYRQTASYGHFGRKDLQLLWEWTDKVTVLRSALAKMDDGKEK